MPKASHSKMTNQNFNFEKSKAQAIYNSVINSLGWVINQKECEISALKEICTNNTERLNKLETELAREKEASQHWRNCLSREADRSKKFIEDFDKKRDENSDLHRKIAELEATLTAKSKRGRRKTK